EDGAHDRIVVTASKRGEESVQDVPLSLTAIAGQELRRAGAVEFIDFATKAPNLSFGYTDDGRINARGVAIRGISGAGTTGFYIDDTPLQEGISPLVLDLERVEKLRGPQGSLYGSQSMGGTVRLISVKPDVEAVSGTAHASVSSVSEGDLAYGIDGAINVPLSPKAAVRVAAYYDDYSGVFDRFFPNPDDPSETLVNENVDSQKTYGFQAALALYPTENLEILPRIWRQSIDQDGAPFADFAPGVFEQNRAVDLQEPAEDEWTNYNLSVTYDVGFGEFVSSTSYFTRDLSESEDNTEVFQLLLGLPEPIPVSSPQFDSFDIVTQEARFASSFDGPFQVVAGVFYFDEERNPSLGPIPIEGVAPDFASFDIQLDTREIALFGEASYALTEQLSLTAGGRWFDIKVEDQTTFGGIFFGGIPEANVTQEEDGFNPKVLVEFDATDDLMIYASASQGFRRGGTNPVPVAPLCEGDLDALGLTLGDTRTFLSDSLWNYEIGAKSAWRNGRLTANGAAFFMDWEDIQQQINLACGSRFNGNAGAAELMGFELELLAEPIDNLVLSLGVGYTDAEITEASEELPFQVGDPVSQVPEWTLSASADYSFPVWAGAEGFVRGDYRYIGESSSFNVVEDASIDPVPREAYDLLDLRAGVQLDSYEIALLVKNAFDEHANLADNISIGIALPDRPRFV
ncbi:MAG: TonB-dependent receptor, partial [Caulobacterales bacterium]|nr:TonB-dependent receptor [Caulobacterales bacterium]